jgi:hypothetical protein
MYQRQTFPLPHPAPHTVRRIHRTLAVLACVVLLTTLAAPGAQAIENYAGTVDGQCLTHKGVSYNVIATTSAPNWKVADLDYVFATSPAQLKTIDPNPTTRLVHVSPGSYHVLVGNTGYSSTGQGYQATYVIEAPDCTPEPKGMTWTLRRSHPSTGTVLVGCGQVCDAAQGDTPCSTELPILCIRKSGPGFPLPLPAGVDDSNRYSRWSGGIVATTAPTLPPKTLAEANDRCAQDFGPGWRVAEHHDGWGWAFQAYGGVGDASSRLWVHINDRPNALCWK